MSTRAVPLRLFLLASLAPACGDEPDDATSARPDAPHEEASPESTRSPSLETLLSQPFVTVQPMEHRASTKVQPTIVGVRLVYSDIRVTVERDVATTVLTEVFMNDRDGEASTTYRFPLPDDATVRGFADFVDGRRVEAKLDEKERARDRYEEAVARGERAALGETEQRTFAMDLAPIAPHTARRVELTYVQSLRPTAGQRRYVFPADHTNANRPSVLDAELTVRTIGPLAEAKLPNQPDGQIRTGEGAIVATVHREDAPLDSDLVLQWDEVSQPLEVDVVSHSVGGDEAFAEAVFAFNAVPEAITMPERRFVFVLDTSLSMAGAPLEHGKTLIERALDHVTARDQVALIAFSDELRSWGSFEVATDATKARLVDELRREKAGGSSLLAAALDQAGLLLGDHAGTIVVLSDGQPTGEDELDTIGTTLGAEAFRAHNVVVGLFNYPELESRFETFPNRTVRYVPDGAAANAVIDGLARLASAPVLEEVTYTLEGAQEGTVHGRMPTRLPMGDRVRLLAKAHGPFGVEVHAKLAGKVVSRRVRLEASEPVQRSVLPVEWARARIADLEDQHRTAADHESQRSIRREVVALSRKYGVGSRFTSFLAHDSLGPDHIKPGDPEIRIHAPRSSGPVYGVLPWGEIVRCTWREEDGAWYGRFLVPRGITDGLYWVEVFTEPQGLALLRSRLPFRVDSAPPTLSVETSWDGEGLHVTVTSETVERRAGGDTLIEDGRDLKWVSARSGEGPPVRLRRVDDTRWEGTVPIREDAAAPPVLHLVASDYARNTRELRHEVRRP